MTISRRELITALPIAFYAFGLFAKQPISYLPPSELFDAELNTVGENTLESDIFDVKEVVAGAAPDQDEFNFYKHRYYFAGNNRFAGRFGDGENMFNGGYPSIYGVHLSGQQHEGDINFYYRFRKFFNVQSRIITGKVQPDGTCDTCGVREAEFKGKRLLKEEGLLEKLAALPGGVKYQREAWDPGTPTLEGEGFFAGSSPWIVLRTTEPDPKFNSMRIDVTYAPPKMNAIGRVYVDGEVVDKVEFGGAVRRIG